MPIFHALLNHSKIGVQKEAAWTLSNITAGTQVQIQSVVSSELVPLLVHTLATGELRVQKEAAWAITNYTSGANTDQVLYLVQCQVIKPMCDLLVTKDPKLIKVLLDGLCNILLVWKIISNNKKSYRFTFKNENVWNFYIPAPYRFSFISDHYFRREIMNVQYRRISVIYFRFYK